MREAISNTAEFAALQGGTRIVTADTRTEMRRILREVRSGQLAQKLMEDAAAGYPRLKASRAKAALTRSRRSGERLRKLRNDLRETERLILRRPRDEDLEPLCAAGPTPELTRYTGDKPDVRAFLSELIADMQAKLPGEMEPGGPWYQFIVERRSDGPSSRHRRRLRHSGRAAGGARLPDPP
jgi:hypothetical protein